MISGFGFRLLRALAVVVGIVGLWSATVAVQTQEPSKRIVSFNADHQDAREAISALFRSGTVSYSIAPEIQGSVTLKLENMQFDRVLRSLLAQVDATFRVAEGIYQIVPISQVEAVSDLFRLHPRSLPRVVDETPPSKQAEKKQDPPVISQDDQFLYILRGLVLYKVRKSDLKTVSVRLLGS